MSLARVFEWEDVLEASSDDGYDDESTRDDDETVERTGKASAPARGTNDEFVIVTATVIATVFVTEYESTCRRFADCGRLDDKVSL